jgi:hypothetical protein
MAVTGDITPRKNIVQIRSVNGDGRIFGIRLEIGYDEYRRPEIRSLLQRGNLYPEPTMMPSPIVNREG